LASTWLFARAARRSAANQAPCYLDPCAANS
jgi:hypothetical protein